MWSILRDEVREVVWLTCTVAALSCAGVAAAVLLSYFIPAL